MREESHTCCSLSSLRRQPVGASACVVSCYPTHSASERTLALANRGKSFCRSFSVRKCLAGLQSICPHAPMPGAPQIRQGLKLRHEGRSDGSCQGKAATFQIRDRAIELRALQGSRTKFCKIAFGISNCTSVEERLRAIAEDSRSEAFVGIGGNLQAVLRACTFHSLHF